MTEEGPRKPKSPARFMAVGCTVVIGIVAVIAVLAGVAFYKISRGMDEIAQIGQTWLGRQAQATGEFGDIQRIEAVPGKRSLQVEKGDAGSGWFEYQVTGSKASGRARVSMVRRDGEWRAVGARLTVGDRETAIGSPP